MHSEWTTKSNVYAIPKKFAENNIRKQIKGGKSGQDIILIFLKKYSIFKMRY